MKKKIALFVNSLQKGGAERVMGNLAEYLYSQGHDVVLVTQYKREVEYEINPNIRRVYSEPEASKVQGSRLHNFIVRFITLRNIWKTEKPDVVLSFIGKNNIMTVGTSRFLPPKIVVSVRAEPTIEYETPLMVFLANFLFRFADGVVLQTTQAKEFFSKGVQRKSVIIANPINPGFMNRRYEGEKDNRIVAVARLHESKNQALLVRAFAMIADEFPEMRVEIYGEGDCREPLTELIKEKKMENRITLMGSVSDIADRICQARVFVLPSDTEGLPNGLMEAMALGLTCVATDCPCGGPAELIEDGVNGLLIPVGDAQAMADALRRVLSDEKFADELADNAYKSSARLHPDIVNKNWEDYLTNL